jgi:hypothetical protein
MMVARVLELPKYKILKKTELFAKLFNVKKEAMDHPLCRKKQRTSYESKVNLDSYASDKWKKTFLRQRPSVDWRKLSQLKNNFMNPPENFVRQKSSFFCQIGLVSETLLSKSFDHRLFFMQSSPVQIKF